MNHAHDEMYPHASRELAQERTRLAPEVAEAFRAFSQRVFADGALPAWVAAEMRAGGAYAHSALALDTIAKGNPNP